MATYLRTWRILVALLPMLGSIALAHATLVGAQQDDPTARDAQSRIVATNSERFSFALWGDMPYGTNGDEDQVSALIDDMNRSDIAFSIFDGDTKDGSSWCTDEVIGAEARAFFDRLQAPVVYVLGDNEGTDCHRLNNGGYDNLERLDFLRRTMFGTPTSFGQRQLMLEHQGPMGGSYSENTRWTFGQVVFVGLNVPGSNNNKVTEDDCFIASARTQEQCDADNAEYLERDGKNIEWMRGSFALARQQGALGIMLVIQADPSFDVPETAANERARPGMDGYDAFLAALEDETRAFAGQVVLVHGDTHIFKIDKPLLHERRVIENFTRVGTFGSPHIHWLRVWVNPESRGVFTFEPMTVVGN